MRHLEELTKKKIKNETLQEGPKAHAEWGSTKVYNNKLSRAP